MPNQEGKVDPWNQQLPGGLDDQQNGPFGETLVVTDSEGKPIFPGGLPISPILDVIFGTKPPVYPIEPLPNPPPNNPFPGPPQGTPQAPLAGEVPVGTPPWLEEILKELPGIVNEWPPVGPGKPNPKGGGGLDIPSWLKYLMAALGVLGSLPIGGDGGGGGSAPPRGGTPRGGGAAAPAGGLGTLNYSPTKHNPNFVGWNPGRGQQMLGGKDNGAMMAQLFGGRR